MFDASRERIWNTLFATDDGRVNDEIKRTCEETGVGEITAKLLYNRGYKTAEEVRQFFNNGTSILHDPFACNDMGKAVSRIKEALLNKERIVIYGDYDVDGVTSVSSLYLYLKDKGADVDYYIPKRDGEGYGLSKTAIDKFVPFGVKLIITVDTGITAYEEAEYAKSLGIDMIITDHHECRRELPDAYAVVNPHRHDSTYPFKELAGVGVVFKLLCAYESKLYEERGEDKLNGIRKVFREYADLAAIGTIADVMPIVDENRLIVSYGLDKLNSTERKGLNALIDASMYGNTDVRSVAGGEARRPAKRKKITSSFIGFGIAPRINAAGRISSAAKAVELFLTDSDEKARALAEELCEINRHRQVEENRIAEQAYRIIEQEHDFEKEKVIVLADDTWQQGIIGIVASRVTEKYGLPSILITFDGATRGYPEGDDVGKGSGRSIKGMNLVGALDYCDDCILKYGGHELAAGLSVERSKLGDFKRKINEYAEKNISEEMLDVRLDADCEIPFESLTLDMVNEISRLEPFGVANPVPAFIVRGVKIERITPVGAGKHVKLVLSGNGMSMVAMYFGMAANKLPFYVGDVIDVLFNADINEYQNHRTVQMIVKDARLSEGYASSQKNDIYRYEYIKGGGEFSDPCNVIPTREEFALVYNTLRKESRMGHDYISERTLLSILRSESSGNGECNINYIKMKFIMSIFMELNLCGIDETDDGHYRFEIVYKSEKTNLDKSYILRKLKGQAVT